MSESRREPYPNLDFTLRLDEVSEQFQGQWKAGQRPDIQYFLKQFPAVRHAEVFEELLAIELEHRLRKGEEPAIAEYRTRYPQFGGRIDEVFSESRRRADEAKGAHAEALIRTTLHIRCPHCHYPIEILDERPLSQRTCPVCGSSMGPTTSGTRFSQGAAGQNQTIAHFELLEQVGEGSFGSVWKAKDTKTERLVALKIPRVSELTAAELDRFIDEARHAARCQHPSIVTVYDAGFEGNLFYIASQFIEGESLQVHLGRLPEHRLPPRQAAELCLQIAEALHHAHEVGVVHRDLKPANILLDASGTPYVTDFGLAKRETEELSITRSGMIMGTVQYMSPEQARGDSKSVDRRSDIYSLGTILFELLTGERPFGGTTEMLLRQVQEADPPSVCKLNSNVQPDLEAICLRGCLEKKREKRFATARELANDLRRYLNGEPTLSRPITQLERAWRWCKRQPVVAGLAATVAVSLLVGSIVSIQFAWRWREQAEETAAALQQSNAAEQRAIGARGEAEKRARVATAFRLASQSEQVRAENPQLGLLLAVESVEATRRYGERHVVAAEQSLRDSLTMIDGELLAEYFGRLEDSVISPDTRWLAMGGEDSIVRIWDLSAGMPAAKPMELCGHEGSIVCMAFSTDSCWLATGGSDRTVRIWDLAAKDPSATAFVLRGYNDTIGCVAISPDRRWLAVGRGLNHSFFASPLEAAKMKTACLWDLTAKDNFSTPIVLRGHDSAISCLAISPDSQMLVTGSYDRTARLWDLTAQDPAAQSIALRGHQRGLSCVAFSPDGRWIVTGSADCTARLWDLTIKDASNVFLVPEQEDMIGRVAISPNGSWLVTVCFEGKARLWDLDSIRSPLFQITSIPLSVNEDMTVCAAISPDSRWLATGSYSFAGNCATRLWDLRARDPGAAPTVLRGDDNMVYPVAISPDSRRLIAVGLDMRMGKNRGWSRARRWDLTTMSPVMPILFRGDETKIVCMAISPDSRRLVRAC